MSERNRRLVLRERPSGRIGPQTFELVEEPIPDIVEGQALVRTQWLSLDPAQRGWITDTPSYLPPVGIGEVMRSGGLGRVVASLRSDLQVGQLVSGMLGWQEWAVLKDTMLLRVVNELPGVPARAALGVLGINGWTAWVGMTDIGRPQPGETVVVSAAAGAVGSIAGRSLSAGAPALSASPADSTNARS